jgi:hypothetical protein
MLCTPSYTVLTLPGCDVCVQAGPVPNVWLQLLQRCAADPECQPIALRSLAQQLAEHRTQSEQQLIELRAMVAHQQEQIVHLQQQQEQQLSAHQQVVSAQDARFAALESKLQQLLQCQPQQ